MKKRSVVAILCGCLSFSAADAKPVPNLKFSDLAGHSQELKHLRGGVTVVSFWATWCGPCKEELPRLARLGQQYAGNGVRFVLISADEAKDRGKIAPYLEQHQIGLDAWVGADLDSLGRLGLGEVLPATMILDANGEVITRIEGEAREEDLTKPLNWVLGGRGGSAPAAVVKRF